MLRNLVPYRFRAKLDNARVTKALRGIVDTSPVQCLAADESMAQLHMLVCHRDVLPALVALKSLLRFPELKISVVLSDDGSLTDEDRSLFKHHLPGARHLVKGDPLVRKQLIEQGLNSVLRLYDSEFQLSAKLVHPVVTADKENVIVLDPDTAFFGRPQQLIDWVSDPAVCLYTRDNNDARDAALDPRVRAAFDQLAEHLQVDHWKIAHYYFNSGLLAFTKSRCDLKLADQFLEWKQQNQARFDFEGADIWFGRWTAEQAAYLVMYAAMDPPGLSFGPEYRLGSLGEVFSHFMRATLVKPHVLKRLTQLCDQLA